MTDFTFPLLAFLASTALLLGCDPGLAPRDPLLNNQLARAAQQAGHASDDRVKADQLKFGPSGGATTDPAAAIHQFRLRPAK